MASVRLKEIVKQYDGKKLIDAIDLDIADGECVVLAGPSGCGKSTLLRILAGLEAADYGSVEIGGSVCREAGAARRGIALVCEDAALDPRMSAAGNMGMALKAAGLPRAEIAARVEGAAAMLGIGHLLEQRTAALSSGQRQCVALGRAIVCEPDVFLFDAPLSALDAGLRAHARQALARLHRELGATMLYLTSDPVEAMSLGWRIVVLNRGRIEQAGSPQELYERPATRFVAGFLGSPGMNFLPGTLAGEEGRSVHVRLGGGAVLQVAADACDAAPGSALTLGVRPEHLRVEEREGGDRAIGFPATVAVLDCLGDSTMVHARVDGVPGMVSLKCGPEDSCPVPGERVMLGFDPEHGHLFDAGGAALPRAAGLACAART